MRSIIFGAIGVIWGGGILVSRLLAPAADAAQNADYQAGSSAGVIFGVIMLAVGGFTLFKGIRERGER